MIGSKLFQAIHNVFKELDSNKYQFKKL